jgi:hypothetical protein
VTEAVSRESLLTAEDTGRQISRVKGKKRVMGTRWV